MTKYREILRLKSLGLSQQSIADSCNVSKKTVNRVFYFTLRTDECHTLFICFCTVFNSFEQFFCKRKILLNNPVPVSLLSGDRKPQIRFLGNHHSGSGNLYHKSFRM